MKTDAGARRSRLVPVLIGVVAFALYLPIGSHEFLNWDDNWLITGNRLLERFEASTLQKIFFDFSFATRDALGDEYLPLRDISIMIDKRLWGDWAGGFLLTNALFYAIGVVLFHRLLLRLHPGGWVATAAALVYAVHPIHVESVAWASARKDVLCLIFFMASLLAFERFLVRRNAPALILSCALFLCAMFSKYVAVVLPVFLLLRLLWQFGLPRTLAAGRRYALWLLPFGAIALGCLAIIFRIGKLTGVILEQHISSGFWLNFLTVVEIYGRYAFNLAAPYWLTPDYGITTIASTASARGLAALGLLIVLAGLAAWLIRRARRPDGQAAAAVLFWYAWFFAALLPFSQITPIFNRMTDRYLLLPSMSFAVLLALAAQRAGLRVDRRALAAAGCVGLAFFGAMTLRQLTFWQDSVSLWSRAVTLQPRSVNSLFQLSVSYQELADYAAEAAALSRLLVEDPDHGGALNNLGINLFKSGADPEESIRVYRRLVALEPGNFRALQNLGNVLIEQGRPAEAIPPLERSLAVNPGYCLAMANLGRAYFLLEDRDQARVQFERALACNPRMTVARTYLERLGEAD